ncbi:hypothetical protein AURDEDRAFT_186711 [Auricularia subglabra TFB-10046 SS5]|nr:hypothetical protein AURDEDRAFT_186711 [Auricularia subglabra TFB-10046 SS5]
MSGADESQGDAAWRLLNALPAAHASTTSVSTGSGSGGTQSQLVLPSAEPPAVDAYRGFGLAGDSMDVDQEPEPEDEGQGAQGGGTASPVPIFKKPFLPQPSPSQAVQHAVASSSRAANQQPKSPAPVPKLKPRRPPSPQPASQDSFGMPTGSQERARFMRDKGGRLAQLVAEADAVAGVGPGRASPESSQTQSSSEPGDRSRELPEPVVLVAGTPSQSQSQSQQDAPPEPQSQWRDPVQNQEEDEDEIYGGGGGQTSQLYETLGAPLDIALLDNDEDEEEENAKSDDSFDARVQQDEDEEAATQLVATQVVESTQETQPLAIGTVSSGLGTGIVLSEQAERLLRMHNPKKYQQRTRRAAHASNATTNPTPSTHQTNPTPATQQTHPTNTNNSAADRAFVHEEDDTQQETQGTPPPGPLIETQLQSPPRTLPRRRQIPSAKSTQRPATATPGNGNAAGPSLPPPETPQPAQTPQRAARDDPHSSPATNNAHSGPSQAYTGSSSVVPPSVASEVSAPPMRRPPPSQFLSASMVAPRKEDEEIVPDSAPPSSMSLGETPSSQPVPLALLLSRKKEAEAQAQAELGKAKAEQQARADQEKVRSEQEKVRAEQEKVRAEQEKVRAEQEKAKGKAKVKELPPVGKENEKASLPSDASLGPKRQPAAKRKYGGRRSGEDAQPAPEHHDEAQTLLTLSNKTRAAAPRQRAASLEAEPEAFPGEEDMSLTSPSEGEHDPESQPPLKHGSPQRKKRTAQRSPTVEATDPEPRPPRRVVRGAHRAVEPMISMEAVPEAAMDLDLDDAPPPSQLSQKRSRAATRVRRPSAAAAMRNLKEESDTEDEAGGDDEDESYRETQESLPMPPPVKPATRTRKSSVAAAKAAPSAKTTPSNAAAKATPSQGTQTQRGQKRRRVSDNATQPPQSQRKRAKLEDADARIPTVFAHYPDNYYYPATVTGMEGHKYSVHYSDGTYGTVQPDQLRPGPAVGEPLQLRVRGKLKTFTIVAITPSGPRVTPAVDDEGAEEAVSWGVVRRNKTMAGAVALTAAQITALHRETASEEPARAPPSARATPAARAHSPAQAERQYSPSERLRGLAFVLTCSAAGDRAWRDVLPGDIQDAQGAVLQEWTDVVRVGPPPSGQGRWCAKAADIVPLAGADKRAFLLTDVAVMTPKYLMALALGIPCVSMNWAFDVLEGNADVDEWQSYLPCAGEADHLGTPVSQVIATDADGNSPTVEDAVAQDGWARIRRQRRMPFLGKTVLLVGEALVPTDKEQFTAQRCIPPVCLAMGASEVEAVRDFAHAGARRFDIVIVEDKAHHSSSEVRARMAVNGLQGTPTWVKQCLITGKLLAPRSRA